MGRRDCLGFAASDALEARKNPKCTREMMVFRRNQYDV
jgi:hypothetical protein